MCQQCKQYSALQLQVTRLLVSGQQQVSKVGQEKEARVRPAQSVWNQWHQEERRKNGCSHSSYFLYKHWELSLLIACSENWAKIKHKKQGKSMPLIPYSDSMGKILPHHKKMVSLALSLPKNVLKLRTEKNFASSTKWSSGWKLNGLYFNFVSVSWGANIPLSVSPRIFSHQQCYSFSYVCWTRRVPRTKLGCGEKGPQTTECNTSQSVRTASYPPLRCTKIQVPKFSYQFLAMVLLRLLWTPLRAVIHVGQDRNQSLMFTVAFLRNLNECFK